MTFQLGEKLIYPNHGVATVENISSRAFAGQFERYYLLRLTYNCLTVMVPFSHVAELRLRKVTRNGEILQVHENESIYLPIGCEHRLANPGKINLELIEVQTGSYLGEDDIVRLEDKFGRS